MAQTQPSAAAGGRGKRAARRRQPRGQRRRERILEVAEALFAERGYAGASLEAIAAEVGIQQPGLFYYFASKRELYEAVVREAMGALDALTETALTAPGSPRERLLASTAGWVDAITARPSVARLLLHEAANPDPDSVPGVFSQVGEHVQRLLEAAFEELGVEPHPDDVFHVMSTVTGATLFYAAAMRQLMAEPRDRAAERSMERHKQLLLCSVDAVLDAVCHDATAGP